MLTTCALAALALSLLARRRAHRAELGLDDLVLALATHLGVVGLLVTALFVSFGAPDLVLTQVLVETVVVVGFGQWERVAPNDSADNKRLNRRVEIFVSDAPSQ